MKYRKKPGVIEAYQYTKYGKLVKGMCNSQSCYAAGNTSPHVHTIHNNQIVNLEVGDFIIPEPDGKHYYPCKPDIFENTYELNEKLDNMKTEITKESLVKYGMTITDSPISPAHKDIVTDGDEKLTIAVTRYRNCDEFALVIHGVGQVYLNITCIEDLEAAEKLISTFDSFY